jgi:hypothetical protein
VQKLLITGQVKVEEIKGPLLLGYPGKKPGLYGFLDPAA